MLELITELRQCPGPLLPPFPKYEQFLVSGLFYARQHSPGAVNQGILAGFQATLRIIHPLTLPREAAELTLQAPSLRCVDLQRLVLDLDDRQNKRSET